MEGFTYEWLLLADSISLRIRSIMETVWLGNSLNHKSVYGLNINHPSS